jgi:hypothetical protein
VSLINEALKRAKQETIRREAAQKGVPLPVLESGPPRSPWLFVAMGVLVAALAASLTALLMVYRSEASPPARPEPIPVAAVQVEAAPAPTTPTPLETIDIEEQGVAEVSPAPSRPTARPEPTAPTVSTIPRPEPSPAAAADRMPVEAPDAVIGLAEAPVEPSGASYLHRAELAEGVTLELGGIAWSESGPIALLNGQAVGQGERVNGYLVVEIQPQQIELRGTAGTVFIRIK